MTERTQADLIADCVHCGFCLPACPTYRSWALEADSPRGRIDLMKGVEEGAIGLGPSVAKHIDLCLGCMACVTACPSGVRYDLLIESARVNVERETKRGFFDSTFRNLIFAILPYPSRLSTLRLPLAIYARSGLRRLLRATRVLALLPLRLQQLEELAPPLASEQALPTFVEARGLRRKTVGLVAGCVQRVFFPNVNAATIRVLRAEGCDVVIPPGQGCCGALSLHAGRLKEAKRFARSLIERFEGERLDAIVVNAAGCGSAMKQYGELFAAEPGMQERAQRFASRVRDASEFLADLVPVAPRAPLAKRIAYHDACHLAHAQRIREQPRRLLCGIPGVELVEVPDGDQCCGSAGTYNLFEPHSAREIGDRKADNVVSATGAELLASANPGCTLQIQSRLRARQKSIDAAHPIEILDRSIGEAAPEALTSRLRSA